VFGSKKKVTVGIAEKMSKDSHPQITIQKKQTFQPIKRLSLHQNPSSYKIAGSSTSIVAFANVGETPNVGQNQQLFF
jgi:hypothetical protein